MNNGKREKPVNTAKAAKTTKTATKKKATPTFKVDKSPAARAFAKAVKLTHKRLYGEK